jgi:hypothetical protein
MTLEQEISAALTSDTITSGALTALVARAQADIIEADEEAPGPRDSSVKRGLPPEGCRP